ncbi:MAG: N-acetylmuramoyl-L-alanine amidase [Planctomycetes bacterium]|nr:N-acetylmuramoyl-L-alanine amidase [Planctomycetota bacterium]
MRWQHLGACLALPLSVCLADTHLVPNPAGPLAGRTVVVSPGHGKLPVAGGYGFQRPVLHEILEDIHTNEIVIQYLQRYLVNAGAHVESCRERSFQTEELFVTTTDPGYTQTGVWTASTATPGFYGSEYRYAQVSANETASATFAFTAPASGRYPVYVRYGRGPNRNAAARHRVAHAGGVSEVIVDQQAWGLGWTFLGEFYFEAGAPASVTVSNQGPDPTQVTIANAIRVGGGIGPSGEPRWRESAVTFLPHKGFVNGNGDVTIRPVYAVNLAGGDLTRWRRDYLYVALHTNAAGGGARGISTYSYANGRGGSGPTHYPTAPSPLQDEADALRDRINASIRDAVRASFDPTWRDLGGRTANFGELRECRNMPGCLIELGFHDDPDDAALLRSAGFRAVAARAIYKGIVRYWAPGSALIPLPPSSLRLENIGAGQLRIRWEGTLDPSEPSAAPSAFKVYLSRDGRGFDDGQTVQGTELVLQGLAAGETVFAKVAALNAGGESLCSKVGGAVVGEPGTGVALVDGFDRRFRHTWLNVERAYTGDYAREHVDAWTAALPVSVPLDYAENEAVASGALTLTRYGLVDWLLGREGSVERTFDPAEQGLVDAYLQAGGRLLTGSTELGWDLEAQGGGVAFLQQVLGAAFVRDDAGTQVALVAPGAPLRARTLDFSRGRYDAASPDVLQPQPGGNAEVLLAYDAAGAPPAAVGVARRSVAMGFGLEAIADPADRAELLRDLVVYLDPTLTAGVAPTQSSSTGSSSSGSSSTASGVTTVTTSSRRRSSGCSMTPDVDEASSWTLLGLFLALLGLLVWRRQQTPKRVLWPLDPAAPGFSLLTWSAEQLHARSGSTPDARA